jgi:hypothetical protein
MLTSPKRLGFFLCALLLVAALVPAAAGAHTGFPATGSLYFGKPTAKVVGQTAIVPVKCVGAKGSTCSGTISLSSDSVSTEAPFTVTSGGNRTVAIPVASAAGTAVVATAQTAQADGSYLTTTEVLRLR